MNCIKCGAPLRGVARYCNVCGTAQPVGATLPVEESNARVRRPSRPLRDEDGYGVAAPVSRPLGRETGILGRSSAEPFAASASDIPTKPRTPQIPPGAAQSEVSDQPTAEYAILPAGAGQPSDSLLPWPLPIGEVLVDRYCVSAVVTASPDQPGAQNLYRVVDLLGYERCWSCGTRHGPEAAGERFCPQCGADMLGHEYLLSEHRQESEHDTRPEIPATLEGAAADEIFQSFARMGRRYQVSEIESDRMRFPFGPHVTIAGASHVGLTRAGETNEDSFGSLTLNIAHDSQRQPLAIAIVADGLGGHASGQDASRLAVRIFIERMIQSLALPLVTPRGSSLPPDEAVELALREAAQAANAAVCQANAQGAGDMGSTMVALVIVGEMAWIANLGDSRVYVFDGVSLRRATSDHSLVEQLILGGMVTPEERYTHPQRNKIFRSLGSDEEAELDVFTQKLRPGMRVLLCSDGLWEMTHDPELEHILRDTASPYAACEALIASANANGGDDNITAVIAQIDA